MKYLYLILAAALLLPTGMAAQGLMVSQPTRDFVADFGPYPIQFEQKGSQTFTIHYGWYENHVVYFVPWAASNAAFAQGLNAFSNFMMAVDPPPKNLVGAESNWIYAPFNGVQYAPKLNCVLGDDALNDLYWINGGNSVVFTASPNPNLQAPGTYTPLWRVHLLNSVPPSPAIGYGNAEEVIADLAAGSLTEVNSANPIVLDATIVGDDTPWIIPQSRGFITKGLFGRYMCFPQYKVIYWNFGWIPCYSMLMMDVSDPIAAREFGADYAPRLVNVETPFEKPGNGDIGNLTSTGHCANVALAVTWDPLNHIGVPPGQEPLIDEVPTPNFRGVNTNPLYNPIKEWELLNHDLIPASTVLLTPNAYIRAAHYPTSPYIDLTTPFVTNSPIFPEVLYLKIPE